MLEGFIFGVILRYLPGYSFPVKYLAKHAGKIMLVTFFASLSVVALLYYVLFPLQEGYQIAVGQKAET